MSNEITRYSPTVDIVYDHAAGREVVDHINASMQEDDEGEYMLYADREKSCEWKQDDPDYNLWNTECGGVWEFIEDGPIENNVNYCFQCGGKVTLPPHLRNSHE